MPLATKTAKKSSPARLLAVGCSLALNVALAGWLTRPALSVSVPMTSEEQAPNAKLSAHAEPGTVAGANGGNGTNAPFAFNWSQIESSDYRQYIANLRAVGCPEQTIRDLVAADLAQHFATRAQAIWKPKAHDYWRKYENDQPSPAQMKEFTALDRERSAILKDLFGENITGQQFIDTLFLQVTGSERELMFLPADRREAAQQMLRDTGFATKADEDFQNNSPRHDQLQAEKLKLLANVLSPDELDEFRMRNSPAAGSLRRETQYLNSTPDEFKVLLDARENNGGNSAIGNLMDRTAATEQVRQLLGDTRAEEFNKVSDLFYINARSAVDAAQLPVQLADQAWQIARDARGAAAELAKDPSLGVDDRRQQLQALQDQANAQLIGLLGDGPSRPVRRDLGTVFNVNRGNLKP